MPFTLSKPLLTRTTVVVPRARGAVQVVAAGKCPFSAFSKKGPAPPAASSPSASPAVDPASLFARIGGGVAVAAVTSELFDRLLKDPVLGHFFDAETLPFHKKIVGSFISSAIGGEKAYKGKSMTDAHLGLEIQHPRDFNVVAATLQGVLDDVGVPEDLSAELMGVVGTLEPEFAKVARVRKALADGEL